MDFLTLLNSPSCSFENLESSCKIDVKHFGNVNILSTVNPCVTPPALDLEIQMNKYGRWDFNFLSGNPSESREFGPEYWPLWLRVFFDHSTPDHINHLNSLTFKACLEVAKTGETLCFLNETSVLPACTTRDKGISQSAFAISILALILFLLILTLMSAGVIWWRRLAAWRQYKEHKNLEESQATPAPPSATPPPLPNSKQYVIYEEDEEELCPDCKRSRHELADCSVYGKRALETTVTDCLLPNSPYGKRSLLTFASRASFRESKLVQTSLTSLVASSGIGSANSPEGKDTVDTVIEDCIVDKMAQSSVSSGVSSSRESPV